MNGLGPDPSGGVEQATPSSLAAVWRAATLRPRRGLPGLLRAEPRRVAWLFPISAGILQSMFQAASNDLGARGSALMIVALAIPIGAAWGILQLHVTAAALWVTTRSESGRLPFRRVRYAVALSSAPASYAFVAWLIGTVLFGRLLFVNPDTLAAANAGALDLFRIAGLYLGTGACLVWGTVLLVLAIREIADTTVWGAIGRLLLALLLLCGVVFVVVVVVGVVAAVLIR